MNQKLLEITSLLEPKSTAIVEDINTPLSKLIQQIDKKKIVKDREDLNNTSWWLRSQRIRLQCRRPGFDPWVGKSPWRSAWQPTPAFLPRESPWAEEPGGLQPMGWQRVRHD